MASTSGPKPVFVRSEDVRNVSTKQLSGEELYLALAKIIKPSNISGIQPIRNLWRIYLDRHEDRVKVITSGLELRGAVTPVHDLNPYTKSRDENLLRVVIKDIPLSVSDQLIKSEFQAKKIQIQGDIYRQKLRVNGQLTSCLNGDRMLFITPPSQPLPRKFLCGQVFVGRLYHLGQPEQGGGSIAICSKCLEKGHHVSTCKNAIKCTFCKESGHVKSKCPRHLATDATDLQDNDRAEQAATTSLTPRALYSRKVKKQLQLQDFLPTPTPTEQKSNQPQKAPSVTGSIVGESDGKVSSTDEDPEDKSRKNKAMVSSYDSSSEGETSDRDSDEGTTLSAETPPLKLSKENRKAPKRKRKDTSKKK